MGLELQNRILFGRTSARGRIMVNRQWERISSSYCWRFRLIFILNGHFYKKTWGIPWHNKCFTLLHREWIRERPKAHEAHATCDYTGLFKRDYSSAVPEQFTLFENASPRREKNTVTKMQWLPKFSYGKVAGISSSKRFSLELGHQFITGRLITPTNMTFQAFQSNGFSNGMWWSPV